jgi:hypothetical protein
MKTSLLSLFLLISPFIFSNQGGPDAFGYTWKDSNEPNGPAYSWFDISVIGSQLTGFGDDNFIGPKPLGGPFTYYWYTVDKCWIGSNGYISFQPGNLAANFPNIPNPTGVNDYITGLMADLNFLGTNNPGKVYYYTGTDTFCISFVSVPFWSPNPPYYTGSNTFQILLIRSDSSIVVNFQTISGMTQSNVRVGIENNIGNMGLQAASSLVPNNYTIKYYYPSSSALQITDAGAAWNNNANNGGMFLPALGSPFNLRSNIKNMGNTNIPGVTVDAKVRYLNNSVVVSNSANTNALNPGQDTTIVHSTALNPPSAATLKFITRVSGVTGDTIPVNDSITQEIVTVDTTQNTIRLSYTNNHLNPITGSISWNGGAGGVGMYFKPPTYPARVTATNFMLASNTTSQYAFYAKIYDDDGPAGTPGTLLDSVAVLSSQVSTMTVITVPVSSNIVIASGGVYVLWDMGGNGVAIATDNSIPISRHSYEVFANIWSTYRDYQTTDFFIGLDYMKATPEDVGVARFITPLNNATLSSPTQVRVWVKNFGTAPDNYFINVNYKLGMSGIPVTQAYSGPPIQPGDSVQFTFTQMLTPPFSGNDVLCAWTSKSSDVNNLNDTTCINVTLVGVEELEVLSGVQIYPNPNTGQFNILFKEGIPDNGRVDLLDLTGKIVRTIPIYKGAPGQIVSVTDEDFSEGFYLYRVSCGTKVSHGKFQIIK